MKNKDYLEAMGFFEQNGWMCHPSIAHEGVFKVGAYEHMDKLLLGKIIAQTAFEAGVKSQKEKMQHTLKIELDALLHKLEHDKKPR